MLENKTSFTRQGFMDVVDILKSFTTINSLLDEAWGAIGVKYSFYQHFPAVGAFDFNNAGKFHGYSVPPKIKEYYDKHNKYDGDPVIVAALDRGEFIWLSDSLDEPYIKKIRHGNLIHWTLNTVGDGICCPLYGPGNRKGYAFAGFGRDKAEFDPIMPYQVQALLQIIHVRYCRMVTALQRQINLTAREAQVLELISYGKTNPDIALILGISPRTVAVHAGKIFVKLGTHDRVSAALRAQTIDIKV